MVVGGRVLRVRVECGRRCWGARRRMRVETKSTMCRNGVAKKWNSMNVNESKTRDLGQVEHWKSKKSRSKGS